jgi:hypothetical protein
MVEANHCSNWQYRCDPMALEIGPTLRVCGVLLDRWRRSMIARDLNYIIPLPTIIRSQKYSLLRSVDVIKEA